MSSLQESDDAAAAVAVAPRVTLADIESAIVEKHYVTAADAVFKRQESDEGDPFPQGHPLTLLTLCIVVTSSGFTLVGTSACASPENFDADLGKKFAYEDAVRQLWPLYGFALREKLSNV